jgi:hypothetical protein
MITEIEMYNDPITFAQKVCFKGELSLEFIQDITGANQLDGKTELGKCFVESLLKKIKGNRS